MQVRIRDQVFASIAEAAAAFGLKRSSIRSALHAGGEDRIGLRHGPGSTCRKPVTIDGKSYPSIAAASRALNIPTSTLQDRLKRKAKVSQ